MLNKNTLGVKKVRGQSEATCKQAGATKSFEVSYFIKKLLTPYPTHGRQSLGPNLHGPHCNFVF